MNVCAALGVDAAEFSTGTGDGRIHLYSGDFDPPRGGTGGGTGFPGGGPAERRPLLAFDSTLNGGAALTPADGLWASVDNLKKYDIVIMSCEGNAYANQKPAASRQALYDYASVGGRVFASHYHHIWFSGGPAPVPTTGTWRERMPNPAMGDTPLTATINQGFPKGAALAQWLVNVGASNMLGQMTSCTRETTSKP